ncbi:MAG: DnaJ domain-containing protein [Gammaproteobacteria bacterium]|nr:DnaJ domain-containing protein [Gammaproteobacteria bacterium]
MEYKDYYSILGVDRKANEGDIKQAYRRLARKFHPDVSKETNAEEKFKNVQEAYEVLKDKEKRAAYDQLGSQWKSGQDFRPPPGWQSHAEHGGGRGGFQGGQFAEEDLGGFSDFFSQLFGGRGGGGHADFRRGEQHFRQRGADQRAQVAVTLEEAFKGTTKTFQLQMPSMDGNSAVKTIKVNIPVGAATGQQLRLAGQGSPGMNGGAAGDLYLEIEVAPHPYFSLTGRDVYLNLPLTPWEAALGTSIRVPTLGGPVGLKIAPATQTGQKLRLKGRGMPGPSPGDQYAVIQIMVPPAKTNEDRAIYEKMAQAMPLDLRKAWVL